MFDREPTEPPPGDGMGRNDDTFGCCCCEPVAVVVVLEEDCAVGVDLEVGVFSLLLLLLLLTVAKLLGAPPSSGD